MSPPRIPEDPLRVVSNDMRAIALALPLLLACGSKPAPHHHDAGTGSSVALAPEVIAPETCVDQQACLDIGETASDDNNVAAAIAAFERACNFGAGNGCYRAAVQEGVAPAQTARLMAKACELKWPEGCAETGVAYYKAEGVTKDLEKARTFAIQACNLKSATGCRNAAVIYRDGIGIAKDELLTRTYAILACDLGDVDEAGACDDAGVLYARTKDGDNRAKARTYLDRACTLDPLHCVNLGIMLTNGQLGGKELDKARDVYKRACDADSPEGCTYYADMFAKGLGGAKDVALAKKLFDRACERGSDVACTAARKLH